MRLYGIAVLFICFSLRASASVYGDIERAFNRAALPTTKDVRGYWAGRCSLASKPDSVEPAVFVLKGIDDDASFPPQRASFSYFWKASSKKDLFDHMLPSDVENHPDVKKWFKSEQWTKIESTDGSLENTYSGVGGVSFRRSVRLHQDEFNRSVLLRAVRNDQTTTSDVTFCYFDKFLGDNTAPPPAHDGEYDMGVIKTGWNSVVRLFNPQPHQSLVGIRIANDVAGTPVQIANIVAYYRGVAFATLPNVINLNPGMALNLRIPTMPSFRFDLLQFQVRGRTSLGFTAVVEDRKTGVRANEEITLLTTR